MTDMVHRAPSAIIRSFTSPLRCAAPDPVARAPFGKGPALSDHDQQDHFALESLGYSDRWQALFAPHADAGLRARPRRPLRPRQLAGGDGGRHRARPAPPPACAGPAADCPPPRRRLGRPDPAPTHDAALIEAVLERASAITRGDPGETSDVQVLAANIDTCSSSTPSPSRPTCAASSASSSLAWDSRRRPCGGAHQG